MRLKSVRVGEFKSILDSDEFETGDHYCPVKSRIISTG